MGDYHVHLHPHGPHTGEGPPPGEYPIAHIEAYVEQCLERGGFEVGFTEHLYRCVESAQALGEFWVDPTNPAIAAQAEAFVAEDRILSLESYVAAVVAAKDRGLPVLLGLEVDYFPDTIDAVLELLAPYPWDFLIGSTHWIGAWSVDHDGAAFEFDRRGVDRAYEDYFAIEAQLAASGAVDALAHVDVVKKFGHRPSQPITHLYEPVVNGAKASGTAVEVSSAGLRSLAAEPYPAPDFLRMFHAAGVPITLASDAHFPQDCADRFDELTDYARQAGYTDRVRFSQRKSQLVPL